MGMRGNVVCRNKKEEGTKQMGTADLKAAEREQESCQTSLCKMERRQKRGKVLQHPH